MASDELKEDFKVAYRRMMEAADVGKSAAWEGKINKTFWSFKGQRALKTMVFGIQHLLGLAEELAKYQPDIVVDGERVSIEPLIQAINKQLEETPGLPLMKIGAAITSIYIPSLPESLSKPADLDRQSSRLSSVLNSSIKDGTYGERAADIQGSITEFKADIDRNASKLKREQVEQLERSLEDMTTSINKYMSKETKDKFKTAWREYLDKTTAFPIGKGLSRTDATTLRVRIDDMVKTATELRASQKTIMIDGYKVDLDKAIEMGKEKYDELGRAFPATTSLDPLSATVGVVADVATWAGAKMRKPSKDDTLINAAQRTLEAIETSIKDGTFGDKLGAFELSIEELVEDMEQVSAEKRERMQELVKSAKTLLNDTRADRAQAEVDAKAKADADALLSKRRGEAKVEEKGQSPKGPQVHQARPVDPSKALMSRVLDLRKVIEKQQGGFKDPSKLELALSELEDDLRESKRSMSEENHKQVKAALDDTLAMYSAVTINEKLVMLDKRLIEKREKVARGEMSAEEYMDYVEKRIKSLRTLTDKTLLASSAFHKSIQQALSKMYDDFITLPERPNPLRDPLQVDESKVVIATGREPIAEVKSEAKPTFEWPAQPPAVAQVSLNTPKVNMDDTKEGRRPSEAPDMPPLEERPNSPAAEGQSPTPTGDQPIQIAPGLIAVPIEAASTRPTVEQTIVADPRYNPGEFNLADLTLDQIENYLNTLDSVTKEEQVAYTQYDPKLMGDTSGRVLNDLQRDYAMDGAQYAILEGGFTRKDPATNAERMEDWGGLKGEIWRERYMGSIKLQGEMAVLDEIERPIEESPFKVVQPLPEPKGMPLPVKDMQEWFNWAQPVEGIFREKENSTWDNDYETFLKNYQT